jgi:hypothetical protein
MTAITFEDQPTQFKSVDEFVEALNSYEGENIWQDLIYGAEIEEDLIDEERSTEAGGCIIYFSSGHTVFFCEASKEWN